MSGIFTLPYFVDLNRRRCTQNCVTQLLEGTRACMPHAPRSHTWMGAIQSNGVLKSSVCIGYRNGWRNKSPGVIEICQGGCWWKLQKCWRRWTINKSISYFKGYLKDTVPLVSSCIPQKFTFLKNQVPHPWNTMSKAINVLMDILCTQVRPLLITLRYSSLRVMTSWGIKLLCNSSSPLLKFLTIPPVFRLYVLQGNLVFISFLIFNCREKV